MSQVRLRCDLPLRYQALRRRFLIERLVRTTGGVTVFQLLTKGANMRSSLKTASVVSIAALGLLPTELNRLSVIFRVPNNLKEYLGRIVYVDDKQVNLQAPNFPADSQSVMMQPVINRGRGGSEIRGAMIEAPGRSPILSRSRLTRRSGEPP